MALAESVYSDGNTFESGIVKSMTAILASPRFLFREEARSTRTDEKYPLIDEFSLASRLSYFLWSTMPDQYELRNGQQQQALASRPVAAKQRVGGEDGRVEEDEIQGIEEQRPSSGQCASNLPEIGGWGLR